METLAPPGTEAISCPFDGLTPHAQGRKTDGRLCTRVCHNRPGATDAAAELAKRLQRSLTMFTHNPDSDLLTTIAVADVFLDIESTLIRHDVVEEHCHPIYPEQS